MAPDPGSGRSDAARRGAQSQVSVTVLQDWLQH
jgi:hypothetical protein